MKEVLLETKGWSPEDEEEFEGLARIWDRRPRDWVWWLLLVWPALPASVRSFDAEMFGGWLALLAIAYLGRQQITVKNSGQQLVVERLFLGQLWQQKTIPFADARHVYLSTAGKESSLELVLADESMLVVARSKDSSAQLQRLAIRLALFLTCRLWIEPLPYEDLKKSEEKLPRLRWGPVPFNVLTKNRWSVPEIAGLLGLAVAFRESIYEIVGDFLPVALMLVATTVIFIAVKWFQLRQRRGFTVENFEGYFAHLGLPPVFLADLYNTLSHLRSLPTGPEDPVEDAKESLAWLETFNQQRGIPPPTDQQLRSVKSVEDLVLLCARLAKADD